MPLLDVKATDRCANCGDEFGNHNYVDGSLTQYRCPRLRQESLYGFFLGGDPRDFYPDNEACSEREMKNHAAACKLWNEAEAAGFKPTPEACPSGWIYDDNGKAIAHVLRAPYGIGTSTWEEESFFEKREADYEGPIDGEL